MIARCGVLFSVIVLGGWVFLAGGCLVTAPPYRHTDAKPPAAAVSDAQTWRLEGDLNNLQHAVDGDISTAAVINPAYRNASITLDLGKPCLFNAIYIDHRPWPMGFCRKVAVLTSLDGKHFSRQHVGPGTRQITSLCIIKPVLARYIRLQVLRPGDRGWSLGEIYVR